jgi:glycerol-3-phosphate dehydrogenase
VTTVALSPAARAQAVVDLQAGELDVLVVGGGVVGAGCALDAVTRGLRVGLIEATDWACGTSSRSSKLIHGGLRYLEMLDFGLVREALRERGLMLQRLAPHLVRPVPFLYPLTHRVWERPYVGSGIALYDAMAATSGNALGLPHHRHLTRRGALRQSPGLDPGSLIGAVQYWDAQVDDARHTMTIVRTAASYGALVANGVRVERFVPDASGVGVAGVVARDETSGAEITIRARQVINATGVWTDETQTLAHTEGKFHVRASKGVHFLVARSRIDSATGLILRTEKSVLFVIPWGRHWIIGTTDTDWELGKDEPAVSRGDIDYLLEHVNKVLVEPLGPEDIEGVYAGLRPLLEGESDQTSKLSREHLVASPVPGLVVVAGGKYTTYRVMALDAVDEAVRHLDGPVPASVTQVVPLVGADGFAALQNQRQALARVSGLTVEQIDHLLGRYGSLIDEVLELIAADPGLGATLPGTDTYLRAEVVYAASHEGARHLGDVLARRTRISIETAHRGMATAEVAAGLMAGVLGWDGTRVADEIARYSEAVEAELDAQRQPDDLTADAARHPGGTAVTAGGA